ncbi:hypothetical protein HK100_007480 [Physocladia obscura]|uniref:AB hydrolase-1 domain-containing protein n=1 Tax=Physocladia obscura TaxID=109957 RepID=A0AAD5T5D2_9FUNG|nr:hypothetical protein HK100_007480 [Physocladia obscura]
MNTTRIAEQQQQVTELARDLIQQVSTRMGVEESRGAELLVAILSAVLILWVLLFIGPGVGGKVTLTHAADTALIGVFDGTKVIKTPLLALIRRKCPALIKGTFRPTAWLKGGHIQTIWAAILQKIPDSRVKYDREILDLPDGGIVAIDWAPLNHREMPKDSPIIVLMHGLSGGSFETYIQDQIPGALANGYRVAALNYRGCGGIEIRTPKLYGGSYTEDVRQILKYIHAKNPVSLLVGIGYSLGANILLKAVGEDGDKTPLVCAISVANPYDLNLCLNFLHNSVVGRVYSRALTKAILEVFSNHLHVFKKNPNFHSHSAPIDVSQVMRAKFVNDFDEAASRRMFGFRSVSEFYRMGGCAQYIPDIKIPTLLLSDLDDPIAIRAAIPYADVIQNPLVLLATTRGGGHIGWFQGMFFPKRWFPEPVMQFAKAMIDAHTSLPERMKHAFVEHKTSKKTHVHHGKHAVVFKQHYHYSNKRTESGDSAVELEITAIAAAEKLPSTEKSIIQKPTTQLTETPVTEKSVSTTVTTNALVENANNREGEKNKIAKAWKAYAITLWRFLKSYVSSKKAESAYHIPVFYSSTLNRLFTFAMMYFWKLGGKVATEVIFEWQQLIV